MWFPLGERGGTSAPPAGWRSWSRLAHPEAWRALGAREGSCTVWYWVLVYYNLWALSIVCFITLIIVLVLECSIHHLVQWLETPFVASYCTIIVLCSSIRVQYMKVDYIQPGITDIDTLCCTIVLC